MPTFSLQDTKHEWPRVEGKETNSKKTVSHRLQSSELPKLITVLSTQHGWNVRHIDFDNAFLKGGHSPPVLAKLSKYLYKD